MKRPRPVHEICKAEDALTRTERAVYEVLWGSKRQSDERERIVMKGYDTIAIESRVTKRNVVNIIQRLVDKGFLQRVAEPVLFGGRVPTTYKVLSYAVAREHQKRKGRDYVFHLGHGTFYATERHQ